jgi:hypothetical protein
LAGALMNEVSDNHTLSGGVGVKAYADYSAMNSG